MRRSAGIAAAVAALLAMLGCGGGGGSTSPAQRSAQSFVDAVTHKDRKAWCGQIGTPLGSRHPRGSFNPAAQRLCVKRDLFLITASCDVEAMISGADIRSFKQQGEAARAELSSGATLLLARVHGTWLIGDILGSRHKPSKAKVKAVCG